MRLISRPLGLVTLAAALALAAPSARACPNCKEAVSNDPEQSQGLKDGYSYSILFMVAMPFLLLGTGTGMAVRAARRGQLPQF